LEKEKFMKSLSREIPQPQAILQAWMPFKELIGVTSVRTEADYAQANAIISILLDATRGDEDHPLGDVLDYLANLVEAYEDEHYPIPELSPRAMLLILINEQGLKPEDLMDCVSQSELSDVLNGDGSMSKGIAEKLAPRLHVSADWFFE
jgi:HTH-type transcriptional regulator / antitoxin HigA